MGSNLFAECEQQSMQLSSHKPKHKLRHRSHIRPHNINELPTEILVEIFKHFECDSSPHEWINLSGVCFYCLSVIMQFFISSCSVDRLQALLRASSEIGGIHSALITQRIIKNPSINPGDCDNVYIRKATENGFRDVVYALLCWKKEPTHKIYYQAPANAATPCLIKACEIGNLVIVKRLLKESSCIPTLEALVAAVRLGHLEIVKELLSNGSIDPSSNSNEAIIAAAKGGHLMIIRLLMEDKRVNPADCQNKAYREALKHSRKKVMDELLKDPRVTEKSLQVTKAPAPQKKKERKNINIKTNRSRSFWN